MAQAEIRREVAERRQHDESWEVVQYVRGLESREGLHVVLDIDVSDYILTAGDRLFAVCYPAPSDISKLSTSKPAELWLVHRVGLKAPGHVAGARDHPELYERRFAAFRDRSQATRSWVSSGGNYEVWHAALVPGRPFGDV